MWKSFLAWLERFFALISAPPTPVQTPKPEPKPAPKPPADVIPLPVKPVERGTPAWYEQELARAKIKDDWQIRAESAATRVLSGRARYEATAKVIGCPWWFVGVIDHMESGCDPKAVLHNGEHIIGTGKKTTLVPKGKGPFDTWEEAAIDALDGFMNLKDWSLGACIKRLEVFNGLGYYRRGIPSPYLYSGTTNYSKGKYVSDGVFDPDAVSKQVGAMTVYLQLKKMGHV